MNVKTVCAGGAPPGASSSCKSLPHTSQHHHANGAVCELSPGSLQKTPYCGASPLLPASQNSGPRIRPPYQSSWLCTAPFVTVCSFPDEKLALAQACPQEGVPKSAPSNNNAFTSAYKNIKGIKGKKGFHGQTIWKTLHSVTPTGRFTIYIRTLWVLGGPSKENCLALSSSAVHLCRKHLLTPLKILLLLSKWATLLICVLWNCGLSSMVFLKQEGT